MLGFIFFVVLVLLVTNSFSVYPKKLIHFLYSKLISSTSVISQCRFDIGILVIVNWVNNSSAFV